MDVLYYSIYTWELADIYVAATVNGISHVCFGKSDFLGFPQYQKNVNFERDDGFFKALFSMFDRYFQGEKELFENISLDLKSGTEFQKSVWNQVQKIPYGQTVSYGQIAEKIGNNKAVRAVGAANGANPVPILIPCHRVVQSDGKLGGYGGGVEIKDALLRLEGVLV